MREVLSIRIDSKLKSKLEKAAQKFKPDSTIKCKSFL